MLMMVIMMVIAVMMVGFCHGGNMLAIYCDGDDGDADDGDDANDGDGDDSETPGCYLSRVSTTVRDLWRS